MPEWLIPIATQIGVTGAFMALGALWLLHKGEWFPKSTVDDLKAQLRSKEVELADERRLHREDVDVWENRTFSALSATEKVVNLSAEREVIDATARRRSGRGAA